MVKKELKKETMTKGKLLEQLLKNKSETDVYCANDIIKYWRYIDFINPLQNLPCISLEWLFGSRGLLAGRIIRLQAGYGKGKSAFMWLMYAAGQRLPEGAFCYHVESEATPPPPDFIASFGCDPSDLVIAHPRSLEKCLEHIDSVLATIRGSLDGTLDPTTGRWRKTEFTNPIDPECKAPILIGVDSFSALGIDTRVQQDILDLTKTPQVAEHAKKMSKYFQDRAQRFKQCQVLLMLAAQEKAKLNINGPAALSDQVTSLADAPIGFHATYSVTLSAYTYKDKNTGSDIGERIVFYTTKNKISPKHRTLDVYLIRDRGFDLIKTDVDFLTSHSASPFTKEECRRHSHGITCTPLSDKSFKTDEEFLQAFYANKDLLMACREKLRIRGFGFAFEQQYIPSQSEIEDNLDMESNNGVEGSTVPVQNQSNSN